MSRIDPTLVVDALLTTPPWQLLALACRSPRLRERAAEEIALRIADGAPLPVSDSRQMALPL